MARIKKVPSKKPKKVEDKTLPQKLLPGAILLVVSTIIGISVKYALYNNCQNECVLGGVGLGTTGLTIAYIILRGLRDYGAV